MSKKSASQIRRMSKRAEARGESYEPPAISTSVSKCSDDNNVDDDLIRKLKAAKKLKETLAIVEKNSSSLNSKEKRTAKRKAEAIALEEIQKEGSHSTENFSASQLLELYENQKHLLSSTTKKAKNNKKSKGDISEEDKVKANAAINYINTLASLDNSDQQDMNAKGRRSAKRKAEAVACEESKYSNIQELLDWYEGNKERLQSISSSSTSNNTSKKRKHDATNSSTSNNQKSHPYILFVGQIPFDTTCEKLFEHFQKIMGKELITKDTLQIRIPNDYKPPKKSKKVTAVESNIDSNTNSNNNEEGEREEVKPPVRTQGFAFAEFKDPELMFACLKLHHTSLDGRRINVLRSAGGGKAARVEKIKDRIKEQQEYISMTIDKIIQDHIQKGDLKENELDHGAILLCKRRSAATVEAAIEQYIKERADFEQLENPSSFFSRIICRVTEEGADDFDNKKDLKKKGRNSDGNKAYKSKRPKDESKGKGHRFPSSVFEQDGVDMSLSNHDDFDDTTELNRGAVGNLSRIFPSMSRGRGRGRGAYM